MLKLERTIGSIKYAIEIDTAENIAVVIRNGVPLVPVPIFDEKNMFEYESWYFQKRWNGSEYKFVRKDMNEVGQKVAEQRIAHAIIKRVYDLEKELQGDMQK